MGQSYSGLGTKSKRPEPIRRVLALSRIAHSGGEAKEVLGFGKGFVARDDGRTVVDHLLYICLRRVIPL